MQTAALLTTRQASERSGISRRTLHRRVLSGDLVPAQTIKVGPHGTYLFTVESIDALCDDVPAVVSADLSQRAS